MKKAILAGLNINRTQSEFQEVMKECENLCNACNIKVVQYCIQNSRSIDKKTMFRSGKLEELGQLCKDLEVDFVVFYNNLSLSQLDLIQGVCGCEIIDRNTLILDIFSSRAKTKEAKIQTEMARIKYNLPKLLKMEVDTDKQRGGGVNNRGSGESRLEEARRGIRNKISDLQKQLDDLQTHNIQQKVQRQKSVLKSVALVGYTNAGKSSLMNVILDMNQKDEDKKVLQKDMLFATLDTSVRNVTLINKECLLFDTVGFVSDLPHDLIEAFKSTLDAAREADLLIHVMDASNELLHAQRKVTLDTLKQIGADNIPMINVYNKIDLVDDFDLDDGVRISCLNKIGLDTLFQEIEAKLYPNEVSFKCLIPYDKMSLINKYIKIVSIEKLEELDDGLLVMVAGTVDNTQELKKFQIED